MAISGRYFVKIDAKSERAARPAFFLLGFFETKKELATCLSMWGQKLLDSCTMQMVVRDLSSRKRNKELDLSLGEKKGEYRGKKFSFSQEKDNLAFISRYFDLAETQESQFHSHYFAEWILQVDEQNEETVFGYFSSVSEFVQIFLEVGNSMKKEGALQFTVRDLNSDKNLIATTYKFYQDGCFLVPEVKPHYLNIRKKEDVQHFALALWENHLACL